MPFDATLLGNGCPACDDDGGKCDICGCAGDGKPWPTAMERAETAIDYYEHGIKYPPLSLDEYNRRLIAMNRAMLAAMREHNKMMRAKK